MTRTNLTQPRRLNIESILGIAIAILFSSLLLNRVANSSSPYSELSGELAKTKDPKVLSIASYDDFYELPMAKYLLKQRIYAELGYDEVLAQASLGEKVFYEYIRRQKITHVVVPKSFDKRGEIFHKWGRHGSINLKLAEPYFQRELEVGGENPVILFKVLLNQNFEQSKYAPNYYLKWENFDEAFYGIKVNYSKNVFDYENSYNYLDGEEVTWINFNDPEFAIIESSSNGAIFLVEIVLSSAYGPTGFAQVVGATSSSRTQIVALEPGKPRSFVLELRANERVRLRTFLPCQEARQFDPANDSHQLFCYGISGIRISIKN